MIFFNNSVKKLKYRLDINILNLKISQNFLYIPKKEEWGSSTNECKYIVKVDELF